MRIGKNEREHKDVASYILFDFFHHIWEGKENMILSGGGGAEEAATTVSARLDLVRGWVR